MGKKNLKIREKKSLLSCCSYRSSYLGTFIYYRIGETELRFESEPCPTGSCSEHLVLTVSAFAHLQACPENLLGFQTPYSRKPPRDPRAYWLSSLFIPRYTHPAVATVLCPDRSAVYYLFSRSGPSFLMGRHFHVPFTPGLPNTQRPPRT